MSQHDTVKSDETLLAIIEALRELDEPGVTEVANRLDMAKSAIHKHLKTLENYEYVVNNEGHYRLSFRFLSLGGHVREQVDMCQYAAPKTRQLAKQTDSFAMFAIKECSRGVFTYVCNDRHGIRQTSPLGKRFHLHTNASGKAILATLSDEEVANITESDGLLRRTPYTITSQEKLAEELDTIRDRGFATSYQERVEGAQSLAASVEDPDTGMVGAISTTRPADLPQRKPSAEHREKVTEAARELELEVKLK